MYDSLIPSSKTIFSRSPESWNEDYFLCYLSNLFICISYVTRILNKVTTTVKFLVILGFHSSTF